MATAAGRIRMRVQAIAFQQWVEQSARLRRARRAAAMFRSRALLRGLTAFIEHHQMLQMEAAVKLYLNIAYRR